MLSVFRARLCPNTTTVRLLVPYVLIDVKYRPQRHHPLFICARTNFMTCLLSLASFLGVLSKTAGDRNLIKICEPHARMHPRYSSAGLMLLEKIYLHSRPMDEL